MPPIQPQQLLQVLSPLLSKSGGIANATEVKRLATLMEKFSNKLVSKVMYLFILQKTEPDLLSKFMSEGGWALVFKWLGDAIHNNQYAVIKEILNLLLICPIEVERLKQNNCPKVVKGLSKESEDPDVRHIAGLIVEKWLHFIKGQGAALKSAQPEPLPVQSSIRVEKEETPETMEEHLEDPEQESTPKYKISIRDGQNVLKTVPTKIFIRAVKKEDQNSEKKTVKDVEKGKKIEKKISDEKKEGRKDDKRGEKEKSHKSSSSSSSSSSSKKSDHKSHRSDKERDRSHKSKESSREKPKSDEEGKESALPPKPSISSLGKIPKKVSSAPEKSTGSGSPLEQQVSVRKGSYSDERHRSASSGERPKTVKTPPTKFRSTGLEELVAKPPPSRAEIKKKEEKKLSGENMKRPSKESSKGETPPEKKSKVAEILEKREKPAVDKPGGVKLIPPKPKPMILESDMFSDALTASAKQEPRKKKRRSSTKEEAAKKEGTEDNSATSPIRESKMPRFYRDTLEENEDPDNKEKENKNKNSPNAESKKGESTSEEETEKPRPKYYPESLLITSTRRGPKKVVRWKPETQLVSIQTFELDETERVNVSRNFVDLKALDRHKEGEALINSRKHNVMDKMEEQIPWRIPDVVDIPQNGEPIVNGVNSQEKDIQFAREKTVLQAIYFDKSMIPNSPAEPDPETYTVKDPLLIPLEDITAGCELALHDHSAAGWPEPHSDNKQQVTQMQAGGQVHMAGPYGVPPPQAAPFGLPPPPPNSQGQGEHWRTESGEIKQPLGYPPQNPIGGGPMYPIPPSAYGPPGPIGPAYPPNGYPAYQTMQGAPWPPSHPTMGMPPPGWGWPRGPPRPLNPKNICHAWKKGSCPRGNFCRFLHPGVNCPPIS